MITKKWLEEQITRLVSPSGGGVPTDPEWTMQRLIRLKPETLDRLQRMARTCTENGYRVAPMQVAAILIERTVEVACEDLK